MQRHGMFRTFTSFLTRRFAMASAEVKSRSHSPTAAVEHASTLSPAAVIPQNVPIPPRGVDYRGKIVLAPMVRSGELPCRLMALKYGADLVWGPETIDKALIGCTRHYCERTKTVYFSRKSSNVIDDPSAKESIIYRLHPEKEGKKLIYQIGTANPDLAVQAAKMVAPDVAGIDVNSGCPKPFSTAGGMGAALLRTPDLLCSILESLVKEVGIPHQIGISVKIRILETEEQTITLVRRLVRTGITGLTVHCRTTPMRPRERAIRHQLKAIVATCHEAGVSCTMNGDVYSRDEAIALMTEFNADGAMIATAAEKNPSVFRSKENGGLAPWREVVRHYVEAALSVDNRWGNTKFTLAQLIPGKAKGIDVAKMKSHVQVCEQLGYEDLMEEAKALDERLGMVSHTAEGHGSIRAKKRAAVREQKEAAEQRKKAKTDGDDQKKANEETLKKNEEQVKEEVSEALLEEQTKPSSITNGVGAAIAT